MTAVNKGDKLDLGLKGSYSADKYSLVASVDQAGKVSHGRGQRRQRARIAACAGGAVARGGWGGRRCSAPSRLPTLPTLLTLGPPPPFPFPSSASAPPTRSWFPA